MYYVTEFLGGQTLREWITANPKPDIKVVRNIVGQLAKALRAFHRMEMLHQDLKPENIMFNSHGTVKILISVRLKSPVSRKLRRWIMVAKRIYLAP